LKAAYIYPYNIYGTNTKGYLNMENDLEAMDVFFNRIAPNYDKLHTANIDGGLQSKNIIASFLPPQTDTLIDLGIGTGLELEEIFKLFPNIKITGIDIADKMLLRLQEKYPDKNLQLYNASYLDCDFGQNLYDAAISVMTFHHYDHKTKIDLYSRIKKCLKEQGIYIECDYMLSEEEYENAEEIEEANFLKFTKLKNDLGITDNKKYHFDTPCTVSNQKNMLLKAGFKSAEEVWRTKNTVILIAQS